jgi:hypothetical protein
MRPVVLVAVAWLLIACGAPQPSAEPQGALSLRVAYEQPPPGAPISIGGYAPFARLTGPDGTRIYDGEINPMTSTGRPQASAQLFELPAGDYSLEVSVRSASDAIAVDQDGNIHRDFGPVSTTCAATVRISPPELSAVVVTLVGGQSCSISLAG